jgi:hypothetical protein
MTPEQIAAAQKTSLVSKALGDLGVKGPALGHLTTLIKDRLTLASDATGFVLQAPTPEANVNDFIRDTLYSPEFAAFASLVPNPHIQREFIANQFSQLSGFAGRPAANGSPGL